MKKILTTVLIYLVLGSGCYAEKNEVTLKIQSIEHDNEVIEVVIEILNTGNSSRKVYIPDENSICYNILDIKFKSVAEQEEHEIFPCDEIIDLDSLIAKSDDIINLQEGESFTKRLTFSMKDVTPFLERGNKYKVTAEINLSDVKVNGGIESFYKEDLASNVFIWDFK